MSSRRPGAMRGAGGADVAHRVPSARARATSARPRFRPRIDELVPGGTTALQRVAEPDVVRGVDACSAPRRTPRGSPSAALLGRRRARCGTCGSAVCMPRVLAVDADDVEVSTSGVVDRRPGRRGSRRCRARRRSKRSTSRHARAGRTSPRCRPRARAARTARRPTRR